jgi:hypothetical protein
MKRCRRTLLSLLTTLISLPLFGTTWYIRPDGGTRYSAKMPTGQCDGKTDGAYHGNGVNQHCAFNDFRFMWDDQSYGSNAWVIAGGDTVIIRGCAPNADQLKPSAPNCRIGWDSNSGHGAGYSWCFGGSGWGNCSNPPIPSGTPARHTRILGQNYANCSTGNIINRPALTQIFGGLGVGITLNLAGAQYVDVQCLEITEHNGKCIWFGDPAYPRHCSPGGDDYAQVGIRTTNTTSNLLLQDVWIHGFVARGIWGPIGGPITMNRLQVNFNGFAGWDFDDQSKPPTPDAAGSSIAANYVTMEGNGCNEEYPVVDAFPAISCYDSSTGGFGDSWSGQDTELDSFTCNHCAQLYNTKDGFIGPHTQIKNLRIERSESIGNGGQQWKWVSTPNSTTVFANNLTIGNCNRQSAPMPGMPGNYRPHLGVTCRAAGDIFSFSSAADSTVLLANNTTIGYSDTMFDLNCQTKNACGSTRYVFRNNIMVGLLNPRYNSSDAKVPGLYYLSDPSDTITADHNLYYNLRGICRTLKGTDTLCDDPLFVNEPGRVMASESELDNFNFHPRKGSPVIGHGINIDGITTDYYGVRRPNPPSIGAVEP